VRDRHEILVSSCARAVILALSQGSLQFHGSTGRSGVDALVLAPGATPASVSRTGFAPPRPAPPSRSTADRCRDRAGDGESDVPPDAGEIAPGDADGDREGVFVYQMETR